MTARRMVMASALGLVVVLGLGAGVASGRSSDGTLPSWAWEDMQAMHNAPGMERMHEQMGPALAAQCQEIHERMQAEGGMMGGQGMMGSQANHDAHHPGAVTWPQP